MKFVFENYWVVMTWNKMFLTTHEYTQEINPQVK